MVTSPRGRSRVHGLDGGARERARSPGFRPATAPQDKFQSQRRWGGGGVLEPSLTASTSFPGLLAARPYCGPRSRVATGDFDLDAQSW